ncbi:MAG TPA: helix-turn-helix transcriptional regulator [Thermoanaerobaculia bacterium]|jgi:hypothetical protein
MSERDLAQLRQVLREAVRASRLGVREIERRLEIGHGSLSRMLDGTLDLRVRHLLALANLLGVPPGDFLEIGCPEVGERAQRRLSDWIGAPSRTRAAEPTAASLSVTALTELIRGAVREEISKHEISQPKHDSPPRKRRSQP